MSGAPGSPGATLREPDVRKSRAASAATSPAVQHVVPAITSTDEQMVREILNGNDTLFEELVKRHQRQIVNFIYRMVGDFDLALDMSQDVFIRVHQALDRFDPRFKFTTWIYRIASNCAIDRLRRHQPPTVSLDAPQPAGDNVRRIQIASTDQDPCERLESKETMKRLEAAIRGLPAGYRKLIVLRHVNSLRYEQIAVVTGLPLGTVKNRIFRARAILRREIDRPEPRRGGGFEVAVDA
jgi:RNA polymerase sigma-70 factor (ECF subfamily)